MDDKKTNNSQSPVGGEMGQSPLVNADIAQEFQNAVGGVFKLFRTDRSFFLTTFIKKPFQSLMKTYREDPWFRATMSTRMSAVVNLFFVFYQAFNAWRRGSYWFGTLSVYYAWLTFMRVQIVTFMQTDAADGREELRRYRSCGAELGLLTAILVVLGIVSNRLGSRPTYTKPMLVVMTLFTIYNVTYAVINLYKWRKLEDPVVSASKALSLSCALVSLYSFQTAAIGYFAATSDRTLINFLSYFTPIAIFLIIGGISLFIVIRVNWVLKMVGND